MKSITDMGIEIELKGFKAQPVKKIKKAVGKKKKLFCKKREKLYDAFIVKIESVSKNNKIEKKVNKHAKDIKNIKDILNSNKNFLLRKN